MNPTLRADIVSVKDLEGGDGQRKQRAKMPTQANQEGVIADMNITESSSASPTTMDSGKLDYSGIADGLVGSPDVFPLHSTRHVLVFLKSCSIDLLRNSSRSLLG